MFSAPAADLPLPCAPESADEFLSRPTPGVLATLRDVAGPILVLGAGGKMGLHLSAMLRRAYDQLGRSDRVIAVSRFTTLNDAEQFNRFGVETIAVDLTAPDALESLPEAPVVFFMAGVKFGTADAPDTLRRVNAELPRRVASRFSRSRIVAYSSGCVYPFVPVASGGASEAVPLAANGGYAASCIAREEAFGMEAAERNPAVALIRLNYSVEFRYGVLVDIALRVLRDEPIDLTTGHVNVIWQPDAVALSIQALAAASFPPAPVNVTGPETIAVRGVADRFGQLFGRTPQFRGTPAATAWLNDAAAAHRRFGPPATSVEAMIGWIAAWLARGLPTWNKPTGYEKRDGRF